VKRTRKVGLYEFSSERLKVNLTDPQSIEQAKVWRANVPPNAQTALRDWFSNLKKSCADIKRKHRGTSHATLAGGVAAKLNFVKRLIEGIDTQSDHHFVVLKAMQFAQLVRDLEHNLALLNAVETQRKINAARLAANTKITPSRYRAAAQQTEGMGRGRRKRMQVILGVSASGLRAYEKKHAGKVHPA